MSPFAEKFRFEMKLVGKLVNKLWDPINLGGSPVDPIIRAAPSCGVGRR